MNTIKSRLQVEICETSRKISYYENCIKQDLINGADRPDRKIRDESAIEFHRGRLRMLNYILYGD